MVERTHTRAYPPLNCDFSFCFVFCVLICSSANRQRTLILYFRVLYQFCFYRPATGEIIGFFRAASRQLATCEIQCLISTSRLFFSSPAHVVVATLIMMRGADLDAQDVRGYTALHYAVESTSLKMLRQLVECGANVNIRNGDGNTPLHLIVSANNCEMFKELSRNKTLDTSIVNNDNVDPLTLAVMTNQLRIMSLLLNFSQGYNRQDVQGKRRYTGHAWWQAHVSSTASSTDHRKTYRTYTVTPHFHWP